MKSLRFPTMKAIPILSFLATGSAIASGGADYRHTPLSQAAGGRSSSADYTIDLSMESGGAAATDELALRSGFAGALHDPVSLLVIPSPALVNEGAAQQLSAQHLMDDESRTPLTTAEIAWSVISGPLSVNATGVITGGIVHANTSASLSATSGLLETIHPVIVLNIHSDNFGSYAGDGLDDGWQVQHFGTDNANAGPLLDPDRDGYNNVFEYHAGLVPVDPASTFHLRIRRLPGQPTLSEIIFSPILPGRSYTVRTNPSLETGAWQSLTGSSTSDNGSERTVTDTAATPSRGFYRVDVVKD